MTVWCNGERGRMGVRVGSGGPEGEAVAYEGTGHCAEGRTVQHTRAHVEARSDGVAMRSRMRSGTGGGGHGCQAKSYADLVRVCRAQGTVEYAITLVAMLSLVLGCAAVWRAGACGTFTQMATEAASHGFDADGAVDIALY